MTEDQQCPIPFYLSKSMPFAYNFMSKSFRLCLKELQLIGTKKNPNNERFCLLYSLVMFCLINSSCGIFANWSSSNIKSRGDNLFMDAQILCVFPTIYSSKYISFVLLGLNKRWKEKNLWISACAFASLST